MKDTHPHLRIVALTKKVPLIGDEGAKDANEENARLVRDLRDAGRIDELADALLDEDRKKCLLKELGITS